MTTTSSIASSIMIILCCQAFLAEAWRFELPRHACSSSTVHRGRLFDPATFPVSRASSSMEMINEDVGYSIRKKPQKQQQQSQGSILGIAFGRFNLFFLSTICLPILNSQAAVPGLGDCKLESNPSYTLVTCNRFGLDEDNRLKRCESSENCFSTSSIGIPAKYSSPWIYKDDAKDAWLALVKAVEGVEGVRVVEIDNEKYYLRGEAKSSIPPSSTDDLEFVLLPKDQLALYRSASRQSVFVYPLQQPLSDGGSIKKRLDSIQKTLGWTSMNPEY